MSKIKIFFSNNIFEKSPFSYYLIFLSFYVVFWRLAGESARWSESPRRAAWGVTRRGLWASVNRKTFPPKFGNEAEMHYLCGVIWRARHRTDEAGDLRLKRCEGACSPFFVAYEQRHDSYFAGGGLGLAQRSESGGRRGGRPV